MIATLALASTLLANSGLANSGLANSGLANSALANAAPASGTTAPGAIVATWVQYGPGSSAAALAAGSYGDQPTSLSPTVLVRAVVTDASTCPAATLDKATPLALRRRFIGSQLTGTPGTPGAINGKAGYPQYFVRTAMPANFPSGVQMATTRWGECEAVVPPGHTTIDVGGVDMKLPIARPRHILVMADTGCRLHGGRSSNGSNQQNCADPAAFPLAYLATMEAGLKPDVILQVGDWFYRDTDCLTNGAETFPGCNTPGSANYETWGDTFDSWNADVLTPAKTLLATAPWIMLRGNHESCGRGARGWYALLDPFPYAYNHVICARTGASPAPGATTATYNADFEPSYVVPLNNVNVLAHDSSLANDRAVDANMAANYDIDLSNLLAAVKAAAPARYNLLATHKPTFGLSYGKAPTGCATGPNGQSDASGNWTEQAVFNGGTGYRATAFKNGVPDSISLFISGHVHQFQYLNFPAKNLPVNATFAPQIVVGTGGTLLDADCITGTVPPGNTDQPAFGQAKFPYLVQTAAAGASGALSDTYAHDEFGFAMFDAAVDANGNVSGYDARIYTISAALAGRCRIDLKPRRIACQF
jgi:hypothetical protein